LKYLVLIAAFVGCLVPLSASADNCSSIIPGANTQGYSGPYGGYDADGRCHARNVSESECRQRSGNLFYGWSKDSGKGFSHCVFRQPSGSGSAPTWSPPSYNPPVFSPPPLRPSVPDPTIDHSQARYQIRLCNRSSTPLIYTAIVTFENPYDDRMTIRAWWTISRGQCRDVATRNFGPYGRHTYYVYGTATGKRKKLEWPKDSETSRRYCISNLKYARKLTDNYRCQGKEYRAGFAERKVTRKSDGLTLEIINFKDD